MQSRVVATFKNIVPLDVPTPPELIVGPPDAARPVIRLTA